MLKKLLVTTAVSGLMLSSAMAQTSPGAMNPDASKSPASGMSSSDVSRSPASSMGSSSATIATQSPDQLLASNLKGADVLGSDNQKIGDVSDILFSKDGKVDAYLLSVGGFLGLGAKEVALAPSSVQWMQDNNTWKAKVTMTKDQLAQAPNFERYKDRATTTGTSGTSAPRSSTMTPSNAPAPTPPVRQ